jgi:glutamate racemase
LELLSTVGIFDSGLGGLTVLKEIMKDHSGLDIIYFGDNLRVPYYAQPKEVISDYSLQISDFLLKKGAEILIIACNTATIASLEVLQSHFSIPVLGIVDAGIRLAVKKTCNERIGIWGTEYTVRSQAYKTGIQSFLPHATVFSESCPELSLLIEDNKIYSEEMKCAINKHFHPFSDSHIDTLVLGCTHYPIIVDLIREVVPKEISILNPAEQVSLDLQSMVCCDEHILSYRGGYDNLECYTTGDKSFFEDQFHQIMNFKCTVEKICTTDLESSLC